MNVFNKWINKEGIIILLKENLERFMLNLMSNKQVKFLQI